MRRDEAPVIIEENFDTSIETVWNSITDIDQMRRWYFESIPSFKPEVGFETQFKVKSQDRVFHHMWKVTEIIPLKLIKYGWKYDGYQGDSFVAFELSRHNKQTRLRLTHQILESFSDEIPEFTRGSCIEGWTYFIKSRLKQYLESAVE